MTKKKKEKPKSPQGAKYVVIVESPTKARTITAILGNEYDVTASMGHVVDLPSKRLSVEVENNFLPHYRIIPGKEKIIAALKKKTKDAHKVFIATDPDREGEAIGWNLMEKLKARGKTFSRVTFHEITEDALKHAFAHPTDFDNDKVNAQTARRVLDRIVGYHLSPLLWKKIVRGLSAGRVQSVALKFIVEREKEIKQFIPKTTYDIEATFQKGDEQFSARLTKCNNKKAVFETKEAALACQEKIRNELFSIGGITKKKIKRKPPPPFTTSLLQQSAFNQLRYSSQKTMLVAQRLYEGTEIQGTRVGLITYMRTDSFHVSPKAKKEAKEFIETSFGTNYLPEKEYRYKEKKGAQMAHEAIRPTSVKRQPENLTSDLTNDEDRLYALIWGRFLAAFMHEAIFETTKVIIHSDHTEFSADGKRLVFDGFLRALGKDEEDKSLPDFKKGEELTLVDIAIKEHTTKPPPRYNDASLVKLLEEKGIGRPSTYAPTVFTLVKRHYIRRESTAFIPSDLGMSVSDMLVEHFQKIMDENFTAQMEEKLDKVEEGTLQWQSILQEFYPSFKERIDVATTQIKKHVETSEKTCPQCNAPMVKKWSRRGRFLSCSSFPKCRYAESITTGVSCPDCQKGFLIERRNKRGQMFYGCSEFPRCRYTSRTLPKEGETTSE